MAGPSESCFYFLLIAISKEEGGSIFCPWYALTSTNERKVHWKNADSVLWFQMKESNSNLWLITMKVCGENFILLTFVPDVGGKVEDTQDEEHWSWLMARKRKTQETTPKRTTGAGKHLKWEEIIFIWGILLVFVRSDSNDQHVMQVFESILITRPIPLRNA